MTEAITKRKLKSSRDSAAIITDLAGLDRGESRSEHERVPERVEHARTHWEIGALLVPLVPARGAFVQCDTSRAARKDHLKDFQIPLARGADQKF